MFKEIEVVKADTGKVGLGVSPPESGLHIPPPGQNHSCYTSPMADVCDQIPSLTTAEKLMAMEALWSSLHRDFEESDPPDWHRELLKSRMEMIESRQAVYEDWNQVKKELRERTARESRFSPTLSRISSTAAFSTNAKNRVLAITFWVP